MRILVLTGIRSEYDMLYPVLKELQKDNHISIVVSGAHLSYQHNKTIKYIKKDKFKKFAGGLMTKNTKLSKQVFKELQKRMK